MGEKRVAHSRVGCTEIDVAIGVGIRRARQGAAATVFRGSTLARRQFVNKCAYVCRRIKNILPNGGIVHWALPNSQIIPTRRCDHVSDDVIFTTIVQFQNDALSVTFVNQIFGDECVSLATVGANGGLHFHRRNEVMNIIATDHVSGSRPADVDRVSVAEHFHRVMNFVLLNQVVMRV